MIITVTVNTIETIFELPVTVSYGIGDADSDGKLYGRKDKAWAEVDTSGKLNTDQTTPQATTGVFTFPSVKVGDVAGGNYTEIESDGTLRALGDATTFNDSQVPPTVFRTGGTALLLAELVSGIYAHRFDTGGSPDVIHFNVQFPHSMKLNSTIYPHLHVVNKAAIVGAANVSFTLTYTWANINGTFPAVKEDTKTVSFADAAALTHKLLSFDPIVPVAGQGGLSSILIGTLTRVNTGYTTANIFHMGFDIHYEVDALGSREEFVK